MKLVFSSTLVCYWEVGPGSQLSREQMYLTIFVSSQRLLMCPYKVWHALIKKLSCRCLSGILIIKFLAKIFFLKGHHILMGLVSLLCLYLLNTLCLESPVTFNMLVSHLKDFIMALILVGGVQREYYCCPWNFLCVPIGIFFLLNLSL